MYYPMYFDPTYVLVLIGVVICMIASAKMNSTFNKYSRVRSHSGMTGREAAETILRRAGIYDVRVERISGNLTDHYDPSKKVLRLSSAVAEGDSIASVAVAAHEVGHALVAAKQTNSAPVQKITIIPRTSGALGYTMQVEEGNHYLMTKKELENKIATFTGGRAAEEIVFGEITTGASNDIEQATKLARAMITRYGMDEDFDMVAMETVTNQYLGGDTTLSCSAETQAKIDRKVSELVRGQHQKAKEILRANREKLDEIAKHLYETETITGEEFMEILNGEKKPETPVTP